MTHPAQNFSIGDLHFTYQDYLALPEDGKRYEIMEGDLFITPAPTTKHQKILFELAKWLDHFVPARRLGAVLLAPCDVILSETNVVQPDLLFVSKERQAILTEKNIQGPPDLLIQVTSPSSEERDLGFKKKLYAKFGVKEYWIVFADGQKVEVWKSEQDSFQLQSVFENRDVLTSPLIRGLEIQLSKVFREISDYF